MKNKIDKEDELYAELAVLTAISKMEEKSDEKIKELSNLSGEEKEFVRKMIYKKLIKIPIKNKVKKYSLIGASIFL